VGGGGGNDLDHAELLGVLQDGRDGAGEGAEGEDVEWVGVDDRLDVREGLVDEEMGFALPGEAGVVEPVVQRQGAAEDVLRGQLPVVSAAAVFGGDVEGVAFSGADVASGHVGQAPFEHSAPDLSNLFGKRCHQRPPW